MGTIHSGKDGIEYVTTPFKEYMRKRLEEIDLDISTDDYVTNPKFKDLYMSYVTEGKTSIKVAFTGDEVYGRKIFTASTFEIFVDREARRIRNEREMPERDIWSNLYAAK